MGEKITRVLEKPADEAAKRLLGCYLVREINGQRLVGKIVETEAYDQHDVASHSYRGETTRTKVMFGPAGRLYVYFTYGMHYCCNVVTGKQGEGAAVLLRALEPLEGGELMRLNRHGRTDLTNGPAKLCQALQIDKVWDGHDLHQSPLQLLVKPALKPETIAQTTRIGIKQGAEVPWRFYIRGNRWVSRL